VKLLHIVFGISTPLEVEIGSEKVKLQVHLRPLKLRTVLALIAKSQIQGKDAVLTVPSAYIFKKVLEDGIEGIYTSEGERVDIKSLHPTIQQRLFHLILAANGLTWDGQQILNKELEELHARIKERLWEGKGGNLLSSRSEYDEIAFLANLAYSAFSAGVNVSAPTLLDEPYLLVLLALTAARAEREFIDEQGRTASARTGGEPTIQIFEDEMPPLHALIPRTPVSSKEKIKETMLKLAEAISGITITIEEEG